MNRQCIRDIMQVNPPAVTGKASLNEAVALLLRHHISGMPVIDAERRVVGFVSEHDCLHLLLMSSYHCEGAPTVEEVMHTGALTVQPDEGIVDLAQRMETLKPKVYPVVEEGRLVGLVTRRDLLKALADNLAMC